MATIKLNPSANEESRPANNDGVLTPVETDLSKLYERVLPYIIININDISGEIAKHTASYAYLSQELARSKGRVSDLKLNLEYQKGLVFIQQKQASYLDSKGKAVTVTEALAKSYVDTDPDVMKIKRALSDAERVLTFWQTILDAMYQRSYMLTKLAEMQQHELLLAGNEYNEGIRQQLRSEMTDEEYARATAGAKRADREAKLKAMRDAMNRKETDI